MSPFSLHHGNCIDILKQLPAASVDMVLTDPPYVCHYRDRSGRTVANDNVADWIAPAFAEVARVMKQDTVCVSFYGWTAVEHFMAGCRACPHRSHCLGEGIRLEDRLPCLEARAGLSPGQRQPAATREAIAGRSPLEIQRQSPPPDAKSGRSAGTDHQRLHQARRADPRSFHGIRIDRCRRRAHQAPLHWN